VTLIFSETAAAQRAVPTVAIVGGGLSGTAVAIQLLLHASRDLQIVIIEPRESLGRGLAYSTEFESHLLNVVAGNMSVLPDNPGHFVNWLNRSTGKVWNPSAFVPRRIYGDYIYHSLCEAVAHCRTGVRLEWLRSRAVEAQAQGASVSIGLESGQRVEADAAVLALGNASSTGAFPWAAGIPLPQPWSRKELGQIPLDSPVLLIGSGLTAVDAVLSLQEKGHRGPIHMVSRRGLLARAHCESGAPAPMDIGTQEFPASARRLLRWIRLTVERARNAGSDWRGVIDGLRPFTNRIWRNLTQSEQRRFLRHLRPYWDVHRHRMAPQVADRISHLMDTGQLKIHAGRIVGVEHSQASGRQVAEIRLRSGLYLSLEFERAIHCAGAQDDFAGRDDPLIGSLIARGLIQCDPLKLGLLADRYGRLLRLGNGSGPALYTLGPPLKGQLGETIAVPEIRVQAKALARHVLATLSVPASVSGGPPAAGWVQSDPCD
jgi:uncharacterized NAD(P)/FAD-binding protein YdhS